MNKVFSKVWNVSLGQIVVASELARSGKKGSRVTARSCRTETLRRRGMAALAVTALVGGLGFSAVASADFEVSDGTGNSTTVDTSSAVPGTLEFSGDDNILVQLDGSGPELTFGLADDVTIASSLTVGGGISLTSSTLSFTSGGPSVSSTGIDAGSLKITNVADGALNASSTDAVNGGQLFATNQNVDQNSTNISDNTASIGTNTTNISTNTTNIGTNKSDIDTNTSGISANTSDISTNTADITTNTSNIDTNTNSITSNTTQIGTNTNDISSLQTSVSGGWTLQANGDSGASVAPGDTVNFKDGDNIAITRSGTDISIATVSTPSFQGADMGGQKITNVGAGTASTDAVNVGQLSAVGGKVDQLGGDAAAILGGGASYDASTGQISVPSYTISMGDGSTQDVDNVGDALALMNGFGDNGGIATGIKYFHARSTEADSQATGDNSIAIGPQTKSAGIQGYAAGYGAEIDETSDSAVAIGDGATVDHDSSNTVVIGTEAKSNPNTLTATANDSVAIGHAAEVNDDDAVAVGHNASAGAGAVGIGLGASGSGDSGVGIGQAALAASDNTIAMGHGAQANMSEDIAIGLNAGSGSFSNTNTTSDIQNVYIGSSAGANVTNGGHNVAVGYQAGMDRGDNSDQNVAMGGQAGKGQTGRFNIAIGNQASSSELPLAATGATAETVAIGREAGAEANGAISIGSFTRALDSNATTVGYDAYARAAGSLALGSHADAVSAGSIALGANSLADESFDNPSTGAFLTGQSATHILSIGAPAGSPNSANGVIRRIVNVAGGAKGTDAVNVNQLKELESNIQTVVGSGDLTVNPDGSLSYDHDGSGSIQQALNNLTVGGGGSPAANPVQYDGADHTSVTLAGAGGTTISNVAAGTDQHDAVNVQQLNDTVDAAKVHYFSARPVSGTSNQNNNKATGDDSLAVGQANLAAGNNSVAIGRGTVAGDEKGDDGAIAMGHDAKVNVAYGTALGVGANAKVGDNATAIGHAARADGVSSIALGHNAQVEVTANPSADDGIAIGTEAYVNVDQGQAFGHQASAHDGAVRGVAIGDNAESVNAPDAYAVGTRALANASSAHAEGTDSVADAENAYAQGTSASAHATDSQAFGTGATTNEYAERSIAFGSNAATGISDPALTSTDNIAMGTNAQVAGDHSIAVGAGNTVGVQNGTGATATLSGNYSAAFGNGNTVNQDNTFVVGNDVTTTQANSVVLGNASTDRAATTETGATLYGVNRTFAGSGSAAKGVVSVGADGQERQVINVAAGNISATSTDAVNGSQLYQTNQAVDDFAGDMATYLGGGASHVPGGNVTQPTYNVLGTDYHNVGDAIAAATTHYYSVNDGGTQGGNYNNDGATGNLALAAGVDASASGDSAIAIGNASKALTDKSIAIGNAATTGQNRDIAIGNTAKTGAVSGAAIAQLDNIAFGSGTAATGGGSVAIGQGALATGSNTTGNNNATAIGSQAEVHDFNGTAIGTSATTGAGATYATAIGSQATIADNAGGAVAIGSSATVADGAGRALAMGAYSTAAKYGAAALGASALASGQNSVAVGATSKAYNTASIAVGVNAEAGVSGGATTHDIAIGNAAKATGGSSIVLGDSSQASGANSLSIGVGNKVSGDNSGAIGDPNTITGTGSYAVGNNNTIGADNAFVLGSNVTNSVTGSVVLGNNSTVAAAVGTASTTINGTTYNFAGASPVSTVSVGADGKERTITNVAAGRISDTSTDAINGSQLYATNQALQQPITFAGDTGVDVGRKLGTTLNIQGNATGTLVDGNIGVEGNGGDTLTLKLAQDLTGLNSIQVGGSTGPVIAGDGSGNIKIGDPVGNPVQITNVEAGTDPTDAANVSQLNSAVFNAGQNGPVVYTDGTGNKLAKANDGKWYDASDVNSDGSVNTGATPVDDMDVIASVQAADGSTTGAKMQLTNVAPGDISDTSTDAVNGSQLNAVKTKAEAGWNYTTTDAAGTTSTKKNVGPDDTVDFSNSDGNIVVSNTSDGMGFDLADQIGLGSPESTAGAGDGQDGSLTIYGDNGASSANIGVTAGDPNLDDAPNGNNTTRLTYEDADGGTHQVATMDDGLVFGANAGSDYSAKLGDRIAVVGASGNTDWSQFDGGQNIMTQIDSDGQITVGLAKDLTGLNSIQVGGSSGPVIGGVAASGNNPAQITLSGGDDGSGGQKPVQITNVADGDISDTSTDAVNGSQLYDVQQTASAGWNLGVNGSTTPTKVAPGDNVDFSSSDGNIAITQTDSAGQHDIQLSLADQIALGSPETSAGSGDGANGSLTIYGDNGGSSANIGVAAGDPDLDDAPNGHTTRLTYEDADGGTHQVATMDDGLVFGANAGSDYSAKLGDRIAVVGASGNTDWSQFDGGQNIMTQIDGDGQITVGLAKDLTGLNSIQFGDSTGPVIGGDGSGNLKIGDSSGNPIQITNLASGMTDASGQSVTDLSDAVDTNAANIGDLKNIVNASRGGGFGLAAADGNGFSQNLGSTAQILGDGNITTSIVSGTNGHSSALKVSLSNDITLGQTDAGSPGGNSGTDGHIGVVGKDGSRTDVNPGKVTVAGDSGNTVTIDGDTGTINGLTNTTWNPNDVTSDQAATEGQLNDLNTLINKRIDNVAGTIGAGWNVGTGATGSGIHEGDGTHHIGPKEHMKLVAGDNLKVAQDGGQITFALQDNIKLDSVMANTFTAEDSAGNKTVITSMGTVVTNAGGGSTHYGADGFYFTDADGNKEGPSVSRNGIDAGGQRITNVKAGKNPTDAVNVKQLNTFASDVNQGFNELDGKIDRVGKTAYAGIASAAALAGLGQAYDPGISSASIGYGAFHGEAALAIGVSALTENGRYLFKLGGSTNTQGDYVTNGSMTIFW